MTRDASVADRIYAIVRGELQDGVITPGMRLDLAGLAARHRTSPTPVREALARLLGEGFLTLTPGRGYSAPTLTRTALQDLYDWAAAMSDLAARPVRPHVIAKVSAPSGKSAAAYVARLSAVNAALFDNLSNLYARAAFSGVQARLQVIRPSEAAIIAGADDEALGILRALERGKGARALLRRFHAQRRAKATAIVGHVLARLANGG